MKSKILNKDCQKPIVYIFSFRLAQAEYKYKQMGFRLRYKKKEHAVRYKEKISIISKERSEGFLVWFHVASVGEALSILPLIKELEKTEKENRNNFLPIDILFSEVKNIFQ